MEPVADAPKLQMVWTPDRRDVMDLVLPDGYHLRTYQPGDEPRFYDLMALAGWPDWDEERLRPWLYRLLPDGWFFAVHSQSDLIVAAAMATHDPTWIRPFCAELGWVAADPAHAGQGLGTAVVTAVTAFCLAAGYPHIHLYTEHYRVPALKIYLKTGYLPYLYAPEMAGLWHDICRELPWPAVPGEWLTEIP